ncbi:MAG: hypothetical protein RI926_1056 [Actinomycetota bacterium]|jgi:hypothetical protein
MHLKPLIAIPLIAIALAGCSTQQPEPQASSTSAEEKPLFASDEEALAAAQAAYAHYLEVSDQIARDGGANAERLKGLLSDELMSSQLNTYSSVSKAGLKAIGASVFDRFQLQSWNGEKLSNYVCLNVENIKVFDGLQVDRTPSDRPDLLPMSLSWSTNGGKFVLESSDVWTGENFCL